VTADGRKGSGHQQKEGGGGGTTAADIGGGTVAASPKMDADRGSRPLGRSRR
jgi:hypothetical protein